MKWTNGQCLRIHLMPSNITQRKSTDWLNRFILHSFYWWDCMEHWQIAFDRICCNFCFKNSSSIHFTPWISNAIFFFHVFCFSLRCLILRVLNIRYFFVDLCDLYVWPECVWVCSYWEFVERVVLNVAICFTKKCLTT